MRLAGLFGTLNPPIASWTGQRVWLVGASSGIGRATASALHARGARVIVSGRSADALQEFVTVHPGASALPLDAGDADAVRSAAAQLEQAGRLDLVVYCAAHYRTMSAREFDLQEMTRHARVNYEGAVHVIAAVPPAMLGARHGHISLMASVAGYRGLPRSVAYGPTKAALIHLAQSMYLDLRARGVGVSVVNPGFVATPLTADNDFPMPALITPQEAAREMIRGWERGHFEIHFPKRFTLVLKLLSLLPFRLYQALVRKGTGL